MTDPTAAQRQWYEKTLRYAEAVNTFVAKGLSVGWDSAGAEPREPKYKEELPHFMEALRDANRETPHRDIKSEWPPSHAALYPLLEKNGLSIPALCVLPDGDILARIGATYEDGKVVRIQGDAITEVQGVQHFGRCPGRRYFAVATAAGVDIHDGWRGPRVITCPWPNGDEGVPVDFDMQAQAAPPAPSQLLPFPDGQRVLLVASSGIFVLDQEGATRLLPTEEQMREHFQWVRDEGGKDGDFSPSLSMEHAAISPDGKLIALGAQDGEHYVLDEQLNLIAQVEPHGEYPHHAVFSADGRSVAFNACHLYNGATIAVPVAMLADWQSDYYDNADGSTVIEPSARVYASISRGDEFILGDAYGYLRAVSREGEPRWQHFIGSTISALDLSADGRTLVASTCAGFVSIIDLDAGRQPYQIGNGEHFEQRRWLFWKDEATPLAW